MAKNQTIRIQAEVLQADEYAYVALRATADYQPANTEFSVDRLLLLYEAMRAAQDAEIIAQNALNDARDAAVAAQWLFHNGMLGAKMQVMAQFGPDSNQVAALGLKKKSERKAPVRASKPSGQSPA